MFRNIRQDVLLIILASICWISLTILTFQLTAPGWDESLNKVFHGDKVLLKNIFLSWFFLFVFLFFKDLQLKNKKAKNKDVEWIVISINLVCLFLHLIILWLEHFTLAPVDLAIWLNFLNNFNILIGTIFAANCFFYFKRLILFQKSYYVNISWKIFEIMILLSVTLTIFNVKFNEPIIAIGLVFFAVFALILSTQMRWVAFLSKHRKLRTIGVFSLFFVMLCLILQNFFFESFAFGQDAKNLLVIDCAHKFFLLSTFTFLLFYIISSILILLFHLPTSSAFEQKQTINDNFKKLSRTILDHKTKNEIFQTLLDSAISTSEAFAGWICNENSLLIGNLRIKQSDVDEIDQFILEKLPQNYKKQYLISKIHKNKNRSPYLVQNKIKSILVTPILINNKEIGKMVVMKRIEDSFDTETIEIIQSYTTQATVSIENMDLFSEALENERYKEELTIAQRVKDKLLLKNLVISTKIETALFSTNSEQVGGDYYDFYQFSEDKIVLVLGDVSGNGTSAAFNMAQLKGVFHSCARTIKDENDFPIIMNNVLNVCLENTSFVSLSFFFIDTLTKKVQHFRCGHLPSIFINKGKLSSLNPKGIGLGIVETLEFSKLLEKQEFEYEIGDVLFCFTDGISESLNHNKQFFGTLKLHEIIQENHHKSAASILEDIKSSLLGFTNSAEIYDDVTCICLKFK